MLNALTNGGFFFLTIFALREQRASAERRARRESLRGRLLKLTLKRLRTHNPTWTLQINGHTDSIGDQAYNQKLSAARAKAVAAALIKRGIAGQRLQTAGLGPTQPKGDNATLQGRALNRRVELVRTDR